MQRLFISSKIVHIHDQSTKRCLRHGFTRPSRPHSGTPPESKAVRKVKEYNAAPPPYIDPSGESTPPVRAEDSAVARGSRAAPLILVSAPRDASLRQL